MSQKLNLHAMTGVQKIIVVGSKSAQENSTELTLNKPRIEVSYQGKIIESFSSDEESFKFPFQAHVNDTAALGKLVSVKLYNDQVEVGQMKLKMQSLMLFGAKSTNLNNLDDELAQEKMNWFPIFKDKVCSGHLQIKTQFIRENYSSNSASSVFEGGLKKGQITVGDVR